MHFSRMNFISILSNKEITVFFLNMCFRKKGRKNIFNKNNKYRRILGHSLAYILTVMHFVNLIFTIFSPPTLKDYLLENQRKRDTFVFLTS